MILLLVSIWCVFLTGYSATLTKDINFSGLNCPAPEFNTSCQLIEKLSMVDTANKIVMGWTAKAACTFAVEVFFGHMNIFQGKNYTGFPHRVRPHYYITCGYFTSCMLQDPSWYKFKVVRNPYDRAVSSYLHVLKTVLYDLGADENNGVSVYFKNSTRNDITFEMFLDFLHHCYRNRLACFHPLGGHVETQARDYEIELWKVKHLHPGQQGVFHRILHIEDGDNIFKSVNMDLQDRNITPFQHDVNFVDNHIIKRQEVNYSYVGNVTFSALRTNGIPTSYSHFYNEHNKLLVQEIFHYDFILYNYSFDSI